MPTCVAAWASRYPGWAQLVMKFPGRFCSARPEATDEGAGLLGMRASAGCVRLSLENARTLFNLVRDNYRGTVPKLAFDKYTSTTMNNGLVLHDQSGNVVLTPGYSVLVYIDGSGGENLEARAY